MRGCLQTLAMLVALFFVIFAVVALLAANLLQALTDRERVKEAADVGTFVTDLGPIMLVDALRNEARSSGIIIDDIDNSVIQDALTEIVSPEWINAQAGTAVDAVYDVLETGELESSELTVDVRPVIDRLRGEPGRRMIQTLMQNLPTCPDPPPAYALTPGGLSIPGCLPAGISAAEATEVIHAEAVDVIDRNPDLLETMSAVPLRFVDEGTISEDARDQLSRLRLYFILARRWNWLLWLLPVGCLLLIALLAVRSLSELGHWWGWPMLMSGIITLALALVLPASTLLLLPSSTQVPPEASELYRITEAFLREAVGVLTDLWLGRVYLQAGIAIAVGVVLVTIGFASGRQKQSEVF